MIWQIGVGCSQWQCCSLSNLKGRVKKGWSNIIITKKSRVSWLEGSSGARLNSLATSLVHNIGSLAIDFWNGVCGIANSNKVTYSIHYSLRFHATVNTSSQRCDIVIVWTPTIKCKILQQPLELKSVKIHHQVNQILLSRLAYFCLAFQDYISLILSVCIYCTKPNIIY